jgi:hypothetical protein
LEPFWEEECTEHPGAVNREVGAHSSHNPWGPFSGKELVEHP